MDEPLEPPERPDSLSKELLDIVEGLSPRNLQELLEFTRSRLQYLETPVSELVESQEDEEIVRVEDFDYYTVVLKRNIHDDESEAPHLYVVTREREPGGDHRLHWEDLGRVME